jgi:hypothetical protein
VLADSLRTDAHCFRHLALDHPLVLELREASRLAEATEAAAEALAARFGPGPIDGKIQAHVITAAR